MITGNLPKLCVGDKVHYIPFESCDESLIENGIVKDVIGKSVVRVVYHCDEEWDRFMDYTGALTYVNNLKVGWK